jgi:hypothetical protein
MIVEESIIQVSNHLTGYSGAKVEVDGDADSDSDSDARFGSSIPLRPPGAISPSPSRGSLPRFRCIIPISASVFLSVFVFVLVYRFVLVFVFVSVSDPNPNSDARTTSTASATLQGWTDQTTAPVVGCSVCWRSGKGADGLSMIASGREDGSGVGAGPGASAVCAVWAFWAVGAVCAVGRELLGGVRMWRSRRDERGSGAPSDRVSDTSRACRGVELRT